MNFEPLKSGYSPLKMSLKIHPLKHPHAVTLLHTYAHIFLKEIPLGLPTKRDIQHHINLIHGAILPNKPAY